VNGRIYIVPTMGHHLNSSVEYSSLTNSVLSDHWNTESSIILLEISHKPLRSLHAMAFLGIVSGWPRKRENSMLNYML